MNFDVYFLKPDSDEPDKEKGKLNDRIGIGDTVEICNFINGRFIYGSVVDLNEDEIAVVEIQDPTSNNVIKIETRKDELRKITDFTEKFEGDDVLSGPPLGKWELMDIRDFIILKLKGPNDIIMNQGKEANNG